jgi:hypothetical protein
MEEAGGSEGAHGVLQVEVEFAVAFPREGEDGVGAAFDAAVDHAGEVDAEEGKTRVGDGVDEVVAEVMGVGGEFEVFAFEGDDAAHGRKTSGLGDAVGLETRAGYERGGGMVALGGADDDAVAGFLDGDDLRVPEEPGVT